ncbi:MAG: hypothetical protein JWM35_729 [Verrucomicrobia bacterium]|nr:hypothetical protein [Verrucomicrobiota bacterium]
MRTWFANLPVQQKLAYSMLLATTVALVVACAVFLEVEYASYRRDIEHTVATLARLTADNSTAAVAFADQPNATQNLEALRAEPQIVSAALYDTKGRLFASFRATPDAVLEPDKPGARATVGFDPAGFVLGTQPVSEGTRRLGTLYVRASMAQIYDRMQNYGWIVFGVLISACALAGLIVARLRDVLARPILELANTADAVSVGQDYSLRARQYGGDELGRLTATFNAMLEKTQSSIGALRESEWSHRQLVRALPTAAYMCDAEGRITLYNDAAIALWGRTPEVGKEFLSGAYRVYRADGTLMDVAEYPISIALKEGRSVRGQEIIIERPDGTRRNVLPHPEPIRDTTGAVVGIVNMLVDITEQKRINAAIRQLAAIVESSEDAIIGKDLDGMITAWNRGAERLYGYTAEEVIGQPATILMPSDRQNEEPQILERVLRDERVEQYETVRRRRDGRLIDVSLMVSPIKDEDGRIIGASKIARDITARRRAELALRASEAQLRLVTDNAPVLLLRTDREHRFTFVNRSYAERNGYNPQDMIGMRVVDVVGEEAYQAFLPHMEAALKGQRVEFEVKVKYSRIGSRWIHVIYVPERNAAGEVIGLLGVLADTGARKEAELELKRARDEALAASRAKDDFLAALSHELRTPLNPVLLLASDAAANPALPEAIRADFELVRKNVNLEARLIDDLLDLTRIARGKLHLEERRSDLKVILRDAVANVQLDLQDKRQELILDFPPRDIFVWGDSVRLQQVFWNVLKNAVKFTPELGRIVVKVALSPGNEKVSVAVTDSGIGMTPQEIERAFQAFTQGDHATPGIGSHRFGGLGLGLAISKMLVELHGGRIEARSEGRDHGATFVTELPLQPPAAVKVKGKRKDGDSAGLPTPGKTSANGIDGGAAPLRARKPRILLVEDHAATRQTLQLLLRNRDYLVSSAETASEALQLARDGEFDLVISDLGLPDRSGYELMGDLRALYPSLPGIALSGYGMEDDLARSRAAGFASHLVKPVTIGMLEDAIARLRESKDPFPTPA